MVLPLFAAFVKGAAEAGEEMIDFKAQTDAKKAQLAEEYNLDFKKQKEIAKYKESLKNANSNRKVGPYTYISNLERGTLEDERERLAQFESGLRNDPRTYALWQQENSDLVQPLRRSLTAAFGRVKDKDVKTVKKIDGSEIIITKTLEKAFPQIFKVFNLNEPVPQTLANSNANSVIVQDGAGGEQTVNPPNASGPRVLSGQVIRSGDFITNFARENPAFQNDPIFTQAEFMAGAQALRRNFENNAQKSDVRSRKIIQSLSVTNPFVTDLIRPIRFTRNNQQVTLFPADILSGSELDVEGREELVKRLMARVSTQSIDKQISQTKLITRAFKGLNYVDVDRDEEVVRNYGAQYEEFPDIKPGAASRYRTMDRNPQAKQWLERVRTGQANEKLVNMLGIMENLAVQGGGKIGGNVFQKIRGNIGGVALSLIDLVDADRFVNTAGAAKAKAEFKKMFESGTSVDKQKLFEAMQQFVAFALAQIVQTGADKISNADVENMKEGLGGMLSDTRSQLKLIRQLRSEAMKNLLAHGGYLQAMGGKTELPEDFGDFIAAQEQYDFFKNSAVSFSSADEFKSWGRRTRGLTINESGISYSTVTPFTNQNVIFKDEAFGGKSLNKVINEAIFESAAAYEEEEENDPEPYFVEAARKMSDSSLSDAEVEEAREKYQRFKYNLGDQRDHSKVRKLVKENLPPEAISYHVIHVADYGFVPFVRVRERGSVVTKRLTVNGVGMFAGAKELQRQFNAPQPNITLRARGGSISIIDRLKSLQEQ